MAQNQNPTFHIGLTLAGAGSAGCYTVGVMDYRFKKILTIVRARVGSKKKESQNTEASKWLNKYYHTSWMDKAINFIKDKLLDVGFYLAKPRLARNMAEMAIKWVLMDLDKKNFLKKVDEE